jgi:hypothetical protein
MNGKIEDMNKKIDQYFLPILDIEPTEWENNH